MNTLTGHGPSKVQLFARKTFPETEADRCEKEVQKLRVLSKIGRDSGLFGVPEIYRVEKHYYEMEYIEGAVQLNECGFMYKTGILTKKIQAILAAIGSHGERVGSVWPVMLDKFKQLKVSDHEYDELVNGLPCEMDFGANSIGYSHGDLTFDNILVANGGENWYLIDPAWSQVESPLWDIGKLMQTVLIGWNQIKNTGKLGYKDGWITAMCYSGSYHAGDMLLGNFVERYGYDAVVLSTACQLARVARWCYREVLMPVIKELLARYYSPCNIEIKKRDLVSIVERMLV